MPADSISDATLVLRRTISAPREDIFLAWTSAEILRQWFCPEPDYVVTIAELDVRVGGSFRIGIKKPDNTVHVAYGNYQEIKQPEKLVFTWSWEENPFHSVVTLTFNDLGDATELILRHELLATEALRESHAHGWKGCLQSLESYLLHRNRS